jgi:hypothetical protein
MIPVDVLPAVRVLGEGAFPALQPSGGIVFDQVAIEV